MSSHFCGILAFDSRSYQLQISRNALWHHLAVTWENVNGSYELFVDGKFGERGEDLAKGTLIIPEGNVVLGNDKYSHVSAGFEAGMRSLETFPELMFGIMCFHAKR